MEQGEQGNPAASCDILKKIKDMTKFGWEINEEQEKGDDRVFVSYPRYTVEDFIRKGKEITEWSKIYKNAAKE